MSALYTVTSFVRQQLCSVFQKKYFWKEYFLSNIVPIVRMSWQDTDQKVVGSINHNFFSHYYCYRDSVPRQLIIFSQIQIPMNHVLLLTWWSPLDGKKHRFAIHFEGGGPCFSRDDAHNSQVCTYTLQIKEVCAQLFVLAKCFKICHIYRKRKST